MIKASTKNYIDTTIEYKESPSTPHLSMGNQTTLKDKISGMSSQLYKLYQVNCGSLQETLIKQWIIVKNVEVHIELKVFYAPSELSYLKMVYLI